MSLRVATWNLQRDHFGGTLADCKRIIGAHPDTYFCLQEVTERMRDDLSRALFRHTIHADENMIVSPEGMRVENARVLHFGETTRSFLQAEIPIAGGVYMLLTGKLRHGFSVVERYRVLRDIYRLYGDVPTVLALDGNHVIPGEFLVASTLLKRHGFRNTHHSLGTHDACRLEGGKPYFLPTFFVRSQLDRILVSEHFEVQTSTVLSQVVSSDHEPVIANLALIRN